MVHPFSSTQLRSLKQKFRKHKYLTHAERENMAAQTGLTAVQVRNWFNSERFRSNKALEVKMSPIVLPDDDGFEEPQEEFYECYEGTHHGKEEEAEESHETDHEEQYGLSHFDMYCLLLLVISIVIALSHYSIV